MKKKISEVFDIKKGNPKYIKAYINKNIGNYPVYSARTLNNGVTGKINTYDYDCECLTWTTNGYAGMVFYRNGKFSMTGDSAMLTLKDEYKGKMDLKYLKFVLTPIFQSYAVGRDDYNKLTSKTASKIEFQFVSDLEKQKELAQKYEKIEEIKNEIKQIRVKVFNSKVILESELDLKTYKIGGSDGIFDIKKGNSKYTKSYISTNVGNYPVYSSQTTNNGIIGSINTYDYDCECLTWTTDGIHAGTVFYRNDKFSMTTHCSALLLKDIYKDKIDLQYLKHTLEAIFKESAIGESNKRLTSGIATNISFTIPSDINKQKELALKYQKIEEIKDEILLQLDEAILKIVEPKINAPIISKQESQF